MTENNMNNLELVVTEKQVGQLKTNIAKLEKFVDTRLASYTPESFESVADAKKARAELNNAQKLIAQKRREIMDEMTSPLQSFEERCKQVEQKIKDASSLLDEIVKNAENEEKNAKRALIQTIWDSKKFDLFTVDKVFDSKWLNKSYKITDVKNDIDTIIKRTYADLEKIDEYCKDPDDGAMVKSQYLEDLNIGNALDWFEEHKKNLSKVGAELSNRDERHHEEKIAQQLKDVRTETIHNFNNAGMDNLAAAALGMEAPVQKKEWVLSFTATQDECTDVKRWLSEHGIEISSCEELEF